VYLTYATDTGHAFIDRALDAGVKACWVAGDEVYGADPGLRAAAGITLCRVCAGHRLQP
jgi:hypothetical protein